MLLDTVRHAGDGKDLLRTQSGICRVSDRREQNYKFISALAADRVGAANAVDQALSDRHEELVADQVSQGIIDVFEAVYIDE